MMSGLTEETIHFRDQLERLFKSLPANDALAKFRAKAWDHFLEVSLPEPKSEVFRYVKLPKLYARTFATPDVLSAVTKEELKPFLHPECERSVAVFIDGQLDLSLSRFEGLPSKTMAIPLKEAVRSFGSFFNNQVVKRVQEEIDPFAALNAAFATHPLFLYVPPKTLFSSPLQIIQLVTKPGMLSTPRLEIFVGALSEVSLIHTTGRIGEVEAFHNGTMHISLEEGAKCTYFKWLPALPEKEWHFDALRATLKKDASFTSFSFQTGSEAVREDYRVALVGPHAEVDLMGMALLNRSQDSHTHVWVDHQAPECRSNQLFKGVVSDTARCCFEGKIYVHKLAQKTQAFQLNQHLLLSEYAQGLSKPNLEIFADDVKASHGATVGQVDRESLFYMQARGVPSEMAKRLLVEGFCQEIIDRLPFSLWKPQILEWLRQPLGVNGH